ncbi:protein-cysteine N-palmitoyltransferase HHAT isoform X3 [Patella vulgata]|uniref:protein-cysteine N-palmitoyltransferase HHAT isoform X3 n=2 Tax=Patella vulgata TaxID=6465 RepID=UPI00217F290D|nr:protein-cysteine N-palmitoyltransferase HHAT isoform X3 [Patella vulgata]
MFGIEDNLSFMPYFHVITDGYYYGEMKRRCTYQLPVLERLVYIVCGVGSVLAICYHVLIASSKYQHHLNWHDLKSGCSFLPYKKDVSNFEWTFWYGYFWKALPWHVGHIVLGRLLEGLNLTKYRQLFFLTFSLVSLTHLLGLKIILFYVFHSAIAFVSTIFHKKVMVWVICLTLLMTLNLDYFNSNMMVHVYSSQDNTGDKNYYLFVFCLALVILRYISFCLEKCEFKKPFNIYSFLDMLNYIFYLPLFFTGPVLSYDHFSQQMAKKPPLWTQTRIKMTLIGFSRVIFWAVFNEFIIHYLYFDAIHHQLDLLYKISLWTLVGIAYCQGQFFFTKYVVMYELPGELAKLDGMVTPIGPKCVSYVYRFSHMWKCFDRGFYYFLKKYIYIPVGGSKHGFVWQLTGSFLCFMFIYIWHGAEIYLLFWCLLNYLGCTIEVLGSWLVQTNICRKYLEKIGNDNKRRLNGLVSVPLYLMSAMGIFFFFGGSDVGKIFFRRLLIDISWSGFILFVFLLYCNIQNAMLIQDWQYRNKVKKL